MTDNNQPNWESATWDTSQGPFPLQSQPDQPDQTTYQQPPTQGPTWNNFGDLLNQFHTLSTNVQEMQCTSLQMAQIISDLVAHVAAIPVVQQLPPQANDQSIQHSIHAPEGQANPWTTACFHEPKLFKGKADDVPSFLLEINNVIELLQNGLPMDQDKCTYMASFFEEEAAKQWYISVRISQTHLLDSFEDFCNEFQAHFGNPNIATSAKYKIDTLSQTGSVASYAAHYFELLIHVD